MQYSATSSLCTLTVAQCLVLGCINLFICAHCLCSLRSSFCPNSALKKIYCTWFCDAQWAEYKRKIFLVWCFAVYCIHFGFCLGTASAVWSRWIRDHSFVHVMNFSVRLYNFISNLFRFHIEFIASSSLLILLRAFSRLENTHTHRCSTFLDVLLFRLHWQCLVYMPKLNWYKTWINRTLTSPNSHRGGLDAHENYFIYA